MGTVGFGIGGRGGLAGGIGFGIGGSVGICGFGTAGTGGDDGNEEGVGENPDGGTLRTPARSSCIVRTVD